MKSAPRVLGDKPFMAIVSKCVSKKVLWFIAADGGIITEPGVTYLSCYPENYYIFSILPFFCPHMIFGYFSACNAIDNHNRICCSKLALEKYWVTLSGYFKLTTTVSLDMGITDGNILFCRGISFFCILSLKLSCP